MSNTQKLYCYVDETGQDTKGELFVVTVVIAKEDRNQITDLLEIIEAETGKKATKWNKTLKKIKSFYIERIFSTKLFKRKLFYSEFENALSYKGLTVITIASAINLSQHQGKYKASIFIDGLKKSEVGLVGAGLRKLKISTEKIRGVRDESHAIVRLADALAGFVREYIEQVEYTKKLYELGLKSGVLKKV